MKIGDEVTVTKGLKLRGSYKELIRKTGIIIDIKDDDNSYKYPYKIEFKDKDILYINESFDGSTDNGKYLWLDDSEFELVKTFNTADDFNKYELKKL